MKARWIFVIIIALMILLFSFISIVKKKGQVIVEKKIKFDPNIYLKEEIKPGDSFSNVLNRTLPDDSYDTYEITKNLGKIYNLRSIHAEDSIVVTLDSLKNFVQLSYYPKEEYIYFVQKDSSGYYNAFKRKKELEKELAYAEGKINKSLYQSMQQLDLNPEIIMEFTQIFQWDIDFFIDPRKGDKFYLLYEKYLHNDKLLKYGNILVANYESKNYTQTAYYYKVNNKYGKYYDENGNAIQKMFLKSPLNYKRITSYFTNGRYHPILKRVRAHHGIDYAARYGTPVECAADGIVVHKGWLGGHPTQNGKSGGYGKTVKVKHKNGYETLYGHLSSYGRGIREGVKIKQHKVIGYVGSTGLSTGNHLHYSIYHHKNPINPLNLNNVSGEPVPKSEIKNFQNHQANLKETIKKYKD